MPCAGMDERTFEGFTKYKRLILGDGGRAIATYQIWRATSESSAILVPGSGEGLPDVKRTDAWVRILGAELKPVDVARFAWLMETMSKCELCANTFRVKCEVCNGKKRASCETCGTEVSCKESVGAAPDESACDGTQDCVCVGEPDPFEADGALWDRKLLRRIVVALHGLPTMAGIVTGILQPDPYANGMALIVGWPRGERACLASLRDRPQRYPFIGVERVDVVDE